MNGFGSALCFSRYSMMPLLSSATLVKAPRRMRIRGISAKNRSTMLSQEAEVGMKWRWKRECAFSQRLRLQSMRMPNALNAAVGNTSRGCHAAHAPTGRIGRLLMQGHVHHLLDLLDAQRLASRRTGSILQQPVHPLGCVATAPAA